jgi:predicted PurR-regulated permease PerM
MTWQRQMAFWAIGMLSVILFLYVLRGILLPFIAGLALAYFLDPIADWLEKKGMGRTIATSLILGVFLLIFVFSLILILPVLIEQFSAFVSRLPDHFKSIGRLANEMAPEWLRQFISDKQMGIEASLKDVATQGAKWVASFATSLLSRGLALVNLISLIVITPIVAFYMLNDWDKMIAKIDGWLPRDHVKPIRQIGHDIDSAMAGFVRGQGTVCLILGLFYAIALSLAGLNFGLLIGLVAGFISFVPYVGSIVGLVISIGVALVQFLPDWVAIGTVAAIFVTGQFFEGNFLSPKLVGDRVGLHPVWLMFALLAFGYLFGFVGLLVAVPLAAAVGVLVRFGLERYMESPLFKGRPKMPVARKSVTRKRAAKK